MFKTRKAFLLGGMNSICICSSTLFNPSKYSEVKRGVGEEIHTIQAVAASLTAPLEMLLG